MHDPEVGETIDRFRLDELLARGGMASIFKATDLHSGEAAVLKIPYLQYESDVVFHQRFLREEEIGQRIHHPGIVKVLSTPEKSRLYLAMEYVPGRSLEEVMAEERPLPAERAVSIARQLCDALACLGEHGVVHRDVKPSNVRVQPSGGSSCSTSASPWTRRRAASPGRASPTRWALPTTWRPSRSAGAAATPAPTCTRSGRCSTRC